MYPDSTLRQLIYESEEWGRLLAFLKQENVYYKSRLAEIVNAIEDEEIIAKAENFNEDFLSQDRIIVFLTDELKTQVKLLEKDLYVDGKVFKEVMKHQKKLRNDIEKAVDIFSGTKRNFSGFLNSLL
ncbi:MAG TPA: hypothetical protein VHA52_09260, partial [Candidatus Babeliaceae bacterium]|nr:hypothetical protein [Candidatus Babeliaceae bacterium]